MLRDALYLAARDTRYLFRQPPTWVWVFIMPVIFFYFIGAITGGFGGPADAQEPVAVLVPADAGFLAEHLLRRLEERNYRLVRVSGPQQLEGHRRRLEIPAGFTASVLGGKPVKVRFTRRGSGMGNEYDQVRMARAVYGALADVIVTHREGVPTPEALAALRQKPRPFTLEVASAGQRLRIPTGFEQAVPGTMVMFTLLVLFTSGAITLTIERHQGILRRLATAPMDRGAVVLGKWGARMALGLVQIAFGMLAGTVLFKVHWGPRPLALGLTLVAYASLAAALGMLLGNFARTERQVIGIGVVTTNILAAVGGCWWPIEITPPWAQKLALLVPTGWAMDALHKLVSFGAPAAAVLPHLAALSAAALLAGWLVARSFRFQ